MINNIDIIIIQYLSAFLAIASLIIICCICITSKYNDKNKNSEYIYYKRNEELYKIIDNMKKDVVINKTKYSFIEINDIINIIINLYVKHKCDFMEDYIDTIIIKYTNINEFREIKRKQIIADIKIRLLKNYKDELIEEVIKEKNNNNLVLAISDLRTIQTKLQTYKYNLNEFFELVDEINNIDIQIYYYGV
jgi:hypothetical protein